MRFFMGYVINAYTRWDGLTGSFLSIILIFVRTGQKSFFTMGRFMYFKKKKHTAS